MIILLSIHLGTNYLAVRAVSMRTLNRQRANIVLSNYLAACELEQSEKHTVRGKHSSDFDRQDQIRHNLQTDAEPLLSPEQVSPAEHMFEREGVLRWRGENVLGHCRIGVGISTILDSIQRHSTTSSSYKRMTVSLDDILSITEDDYIIWLDVKQRTFLIGLRQQDIDGREPELKLTAWLHALRTARLMQKESISVRDLTPKQVCELLERTQTKRPEIERLLRDLQKAGWDIGSDALETRAGTRMQIHRGDF